MEDRRPLQRGSHRFEETGLEHIGQSLVDTCFHTSADHPICPPLERGNADGV